MKHALLLTGAFFSAQILFGQTGTAADFQKVSAEDGNLQSTLSNDGNFGFVMESQINNRIFAAAPHDQNGKFSIITLADDGSVLSEVEIAASDFAYFEGVENAEFGSAVVDLGDINNDGMSELIVGAPGAEGGKLFALTSSSESYQLEELTLSTEIANASVRLGEFLAYANGVLYTTSRHEAGVIYRFGVDIAEGLALLETIDMSHPLLSERLEEGDFFGSGLSLTDINQDGQQDIICGAPGDDDQNTNFGAIYLLYGSENETVSDVQKISRLEGDFGGFLNIDDEFGSSVRAIGDLDLNGAIDLAVGAPGDDDGGENIGSVWILFMHEDGWVINEKKINRFEGNFTFDLSVEDRLAARIATVGDLNEDGTIDIVVSAEGDDDGGSNKGAFYTIFIERCPAPSGDFDFEVEGPTVQFFAEGGEGYSYIWNFDDGGYSEAQNPTHTYENSGTYMVCLAINNACGGDNFCKNVQVTNTLGISEKTMKQITVYPNPTRDFINIAGTDKISRLRILDIAGKTVYDQANNQNQISISGFEAGIYLIELTSNYEKTIRKIHVIK
jgi:hypothetical protein